MPTQKSRGFPGLLPAFRTGRRTQRRARSMLIRSQVVVVLLLASTALGSGGLLASLVVQRANVEQLLQTAIERASSRYRRGASLQAVQRASSQTAATTERQLAAIARERRSVRLERAALRAFAEDIRERNGIDVQDGLHAAALLEEQRDGLAAFLRSRATQPRLGTFGGGSDDLLELLTTPIGASVDAQLRRSAVLRARARLYAFLVQARDLPERMAALEARHAQLSALYRETLATHEHASAAARVSAVQLADIQRITAEVHADVLRLQSELARIDARIARRVERDLIRKGLRDPRPGSHSDPEISIALPLFSWPVFGRVSAGFHDAHYERYFGVPHQGMDIVVPQGTPVRSAADGVVFLTRDGGATGYSYVLVGHRGGYATLYGHLSAFSVVPGQDVSAGDVLGVSGGEPGTPGAGPMTTGAHLHFEVIHNGVNVDPAEVLP